MSRNFNGTTSDRLSMGLGAMAGTFFGTMVAVFQSAGAGAATAGVVAYGGTADRLGLNLAATTFGLNARIGNGSVTAPTITCPPSDGWVIAAWTKATGTSAVRFHKYVFATNTWTHENGGTNADTAAIAVGPQIGAIGGASNFNGDIGAAAIWRSTVLTDAQIESLVGSFMAWWQIPPTVLWILDQAAITQKCPDLTGGGANETATQGTSVVASSCPLGYGHPVRGA